MSINVKIETKTNIKKNNGDESLISLWTMSHDQEDTITYKINITSNQLIECRSCEIEVKANETKEVPLALSISDFKIDQEDCITYLIEVLCEDEVVYSQNFSCDLINELNLDLYIDTIECETLLNDTNEKEDEQILLKQIYETIQQLQLTSIEKEELQKASEIINTKQANLYEFTIVFCAFLKHFEKDYVVVLKESLYVICSNYEININKLQQNLPFEEAVLLLEEEVKVKEDKIALKLDYNENVNFSMVHNRIRFMKRITIENKTEENFEDLKLFIYCDDDYIKPYEVMIKLLKAQKSYELRDLEIAVNFNKLYELNSRMISNLNIEVYDQQDQMLVHLIKEINFLGKDEWNGMPHLLCSFITPDHAKVKELIEIAHEEYKHLNNGNGGWTMYQSQDKNVVLKQIQAIYQALWKQHITYKVTTSSDLLSAQKIATAQYVLTEKMGACLDLSLTFASALEAIGLNPLVVTIKGHAFVGCWLINDVYSEMICYDEDTLEKLSAEGINDMLFIETTLVTDEIMPSFKEAILKGRSNLKREFHYALDVKRTRLSGVMPIPEKQEDFESNVDRRDLLIEDDGVEVVDHLDDVSAQEFSKMQIWERKLLDLSLKNSLLNLRLSNSLVQLMVSNVSYLEDELANGKEFTLLGKPDEVKVDAKQIHLFDEVANQSLIELLDSENKNRKIRMFVTEKEGKQALLNLYRKSRNSIEENGTNTLYMSLGLLKWFESDLSNLPRYAPLVLIPVELVRKSATLGYVLRERDEDAIVNITLLEMLRQNFKIEIQGLDPLPMDDAGIDMKKVFRIVRNAILKKEKWNVYESCCLGLFSFKQFVMWADLKHRSEDLKKNKVVASLIAGKRLWEVSDDFENIDYDHDYLPSDLAIPLTADSAQLKALAACNHDQSFVLHGPPGTGKSQTITNMIANALYHNKSVLFIAEKSAALSVVQKRLEKIGLAPFCLELHSNQSRKSHVLSQFEKTLELGKLAHPNDFALKASELLKLRQALNGQMEEIHKVRNLGYSIYDAMSELENYLHYPNVDMIQANNLHLYNKEKVSQDLAMIDDYIISAKQIDACNHPLKNMNLYQFNIMMRDELIKWIDEYHMNYEKLLKHDTFNQLKQQSATKVLYDKMQVVFMLIKNQNIDTAIFDENFIQKESNNIKQMIQKAKDVEEEIKALQLIFEDVDTLKIDSLYREWKKVSNSFVLAKAFSQNKIVKQMKGYAIDPSKITSSNCFDYLKQIKTYQKNKEELNELKQQYPMLNSYLKQNDYEAIIEQIDLAEKVFASLSDFEAKTMILELVHEYISDTTFKQHLQFFMNVMDIAKMMTSNYVYVHCNDDYLADLELHYQLIKTHLKLAREYSIYCGKRANMLKNDFLKLVYPYEEGLLALEDMKGAYLKNFYEILCLCMIDECDATRTFSMEDMLNKLKDYQKVLDEYQELTKQEIVARLSSRIPQGSGATSSQIGILKRAIKSHGRGMSVRKLFDSIPQLIRQLTPCMLMSPLSAAQYIDPNSEQFDYVIFDEASQVPTSYAIGAIARGKNCIIVGDPKQLPPTSFFMSQNVDEEHLDVEDLESILDDCLSISMPQMYLSWHYRSQHESLIAFSNREFYENRLMTFPSANDQQSKISFIKVDGCYEKGSKRTNKQEAIAVVEEIKRRLNDETLCKDSIGVVTFNINQQHLIDDLLLQEFMNDKALEEKANALYEPIFIKNLENVQGDERDVILFSICYGPDENNHVSMNFGPLNKEGGSRRLNVAVSRSRKEMMIFSTLLPHQIDLSRTTSKGVEDLKGFLEFAYSGNLSSRNLLESDIEDQMIHHIAQDLRNLGYEVHTFVGGSDFKVDLAIVDKEHPDQYVLGIMVDGKQYANLETAKDRNLSHVGVLKNLGWNIYQLWIMQWWYHRDQVLADIDYMIMNQANQETNEVAEVKKQEFVYVKEEVKDHSIPYGSFDQIETIYAFDELSKRQIEKDLAVNLLKVIHVEAPIALDTLIQKIKAPYRISRIQEKHVNTVVEVLQSTNEVELINDPYSNKIMIWKANQKESFDIYRISEMKRELDEIAYEELVNGARSIVEKEFSIPVNDFAKVFIKLFGYKVCNEKMRMKVNMLVEKMIEDGYLILQDQYLMLG